MALPCFLSPTLCLSCAAETETALLGFQASAFQFPSLSRDLPASSPGEEEEENWICCSQRSQPGEGVAKARVRSKPASWPARTWAASALFQPLGQVEQLGLGVGRIPGTALPESSQASLAPFVPADGLFVPRACSSRTAGRFLGCVHHSISSTIHGSFLPLPLGCAPPPTSCI